MQPLSRLLVVAVVSVSLCLARGQLTDGDIRGFLPVVEAGDEPQTIQHEALSVMWGLADATATLGKLFKYALPTEAFNGDVTQYKVREFGAQDLPSWLTYDAESNTLKGIPSHEEAGTEQTLEVTAVKQHTPDMASHARDLFTIRILEDDAPISAATPLKEVSSEGLKPIRCAEGSSVTQVTVILDTDLSMLECHDKLSLLDGACSHLGIPAELLKLLPVGNKPMFDASALVAGPGDVAKPTHPGATLQWAVGCGNVNAAHMPILQQLESTSSDGSMSKSIGHGVIGWHVTNNRPNAPIRLRRAPRQYNTPEYNPGRPSQYPAPTYVVDGPTDQQQMTRVVVAEASPGYGGNIQPTKPHRHHHSRTKTHGRHNHHKDRTKHPKHSPTKSRQGGFTRTPAPTPTLMPIQPTPVQTMTSTVTNDGMIRPTYTAPEASPGLSWTHSMVEPSMTTPPRGQESTSTEQMSTHIRSTHMTDAPIQTTTASSSATRITPTTSMWEEPVMTKTTPMPTKPPTKPEVPTNPPQPTEPTQPIIPPDFDYSPILRNDMDRIVVEVGEILNYTIPANTFFDFEDGSTRNLKLVFMTVDGMTLPRNSWVKFDQTAQVLYGLPLPEHEGRHSYVMAAIDRHGKIARDAFEIIVQRRQHSRKFNHEFSMRLDYPFKKFFMDVNNRIEVASKLASVYGDSDSSRITVTRIEKGSVIYAWSNNSVDFTPCPDREIGELLSRIMLSNNSVNPVLKERMRPYEVMSVSAKRTGACKPSMHDSGHAESSTDSTGAVRTGPSHPGEDVLVTTVIPAIVIAVMLLLAGCIACVLYRKNRRTKLTDEDHNTFINKGIPIIFADELEEKPDSVNKPLILANEKPPLPPPEYVRTPGSQPPTPDNTLHDSRRFRGTPGDEMSPLYRPPPPFHGDSRRSAPRTPQQPSYRSPPPYVPP